MFRAEWVTFGIGLGLLLPLASTGTLGKREPNL